MKKFLREKNVALLLVIGFTMSCFIVVNVLSMINSIKSQFDEHQKNTFKQSKSVFIRHNRQETPEFYEKLFNSPEQLDEFVEGLNESINNEDGNLSLQEQYASFGDLGDYGWMCVNIKANEENPKHLIWGRHITQEEADNGEKVVEICDFFEKYVVEKNNEKYIKIDNTEYKVVGVYKAQMDLDFGVAAYIYYSALSDDIKYEILNYFVEDGTLLYLESNVLSGEECRTLLHKSEIFLDKYKLITEEYGMVQDNKTEESPSVKTNRLVMYITFLFSLLNCMVISDLWVSSRYNEFVIRRTYGYGVIDIFKLLYLDLFRYCVVSMILGVILQFIYGVTFNKSVLYLKYSGFNVLYMIGALILICMVTVLIPVIRIRRILPAAEIRKNR